MEKLLSIEELSEKLGIPVSTLYAWTCKKKIPYIKLGRLVRFKESEIQKWLSNRSVHPDIQTSERYQKRKSVSQRTVSDDYIERIIESSREAVLGGRKVV